MSSMSWQEALGQVQQRRTALVRGLGETLEWYAWDLSALAGSALEVLGEARRSAESSVETYTDMMRELEDSGMLVPAGEAAELVAHLRHEVSGYKMMEGSLTPLVGRSGEPAVANALKNVLEGIIRSLSSSSSPR